MNNDTNTSLRVNRKQIPHDLDRGVGWRARVGLVVLSSDYTIEYEFARIFSLPGVAVYHNRIESDAQVSAASLADMRARVASSVSLILPQGELDVVAFGCTSGSLVIGAQAIRDLVHGVRESVPCTTPIEAVAAALSALDVGKIALLTPYVDEINHEMRAHLLGIGLQVPVMGSWNIADENQVAMLSSQSIAGVVRELGSERDVDAVFVSCTNVPLVGQIRELERAISKPVISSNSATAWHCLRLAGIDDRLPGFGRLFETSL